jgi:hypothetical protein
MSEGVKFIRDNELISQLAQRPDIAQVRAETAEADRTTPWDSPPFARPVGTERAVTLRDLSPARTRVAVSL